MLRKEKKNSRGNYSVAINYFVIFIDLQKERKRERERKQKLEYKKKELRLS